MSPFFHGGVRPAKKYPRPWSMNPRLNPDLDKGSARMSILGLPSFETGINLPVFNGLYPKPSRDELSSIDEAVVVSSNGDLDSELTKEQPHEVAVPITQTADSPSVATLGNEITTSEVGNDVGEKRQLEPLIEEAEAEAEAPVDETTQDITTPQSSELAPAQVPVPDEAVLSESEPLPTSSPTVNEVVEHGNLSEADPAIETVKAAQPPIDEAGIPEATGAGNEHPAGNVEAHSDSVMPAIEPTDPPLEQAREMPAKTLPPISEEPAGAEEQVQNLEKSELGPSNQSEIVSGPAGLGPLEVIKEEPVSASQEESTVDEADLHVDKVITNEANNIGGLGTVQETPEILENAAAEEETSIGSVHAHEDDVASDEQNADDTTPVDERREYIGVIGADGPDVDRKDFMLETPFETPMERQFNASDDSTPYETSFETPMERPFWAPGAGAAQHAPGESLDDDDDEEEEEPAEGPFIPRHSPDMASTPGHVAQGWGTIPDTKGVQGLEERQIPPSAGTASAAESATDVEPLLSDEQLNVDDEFRPGVKTQSIEDAS